LFDYNEKIHRENKCVTTCGQRYGTDYLSTMLGDKFVNKRITPEENNAFFNSGTIAYQFANNDEITRRVMEAGGCKLAVVTNKISQETGIYSLFKDGVDIMYYETQEDAARKIKLLLEDDFLRNALAENIYDKINKHHRASTRCQQIINILKK
jgi:spore maturation protein CgeB